MKSVLVLVLMLGVEGGGIDGGGDWEPWWHVGSVVVTGMVPAARLGSVEPGW